MLNHITRCGDKLLSRLSSAVKKLFRRITQPAHPNLVTGTLADLPRRRSELLAENALLRQQLIVLHRNTKTPRLTWRKRLSLLFLARWVPNFKQLLQIIKPDALLRWHREGFRLFSGTYPVAITPAPATSHSGVTTRRSVGYLTMVFWRATARQKSLLPAHYCFWLFTFLLLIPPVGVCHNQFQAVAASPSMSGCDMRAQPAIMGTGLLVIASGRKASSLPRRGACD